MKNGIVNAVCIAPIAGAPMQSLTEVLAIKGEGLAGDRYASGVGSFNKKSGIGNRQVTLINGRFFENSGFDYIDSRRNIVVTGVELNWLSEGRIFKVGEATLKGVKYCDPCQRPSKLAGKEKSFMEAFFDCGGIMAEVLEGGLIRVDDVVIPPDRGY